MDAQNKLILKEELADAIHRKTSPWVSVSPSRGRGRVRLICLPYAGGGSMAYYRWTSRLLPDCDLVRINLPGRETRLREPPLKEGKRLVESIAQELVFLTERPYAVYGHSMGALMAFELCREMRRRQLSVPIHLFVSGFRAPHLPPPDLPFAHLPDNDFLNRVREYGGVPDQIAQNEELLEIFLPILRADFRIVETYAYEEEPPLDCSITAFGGLSDPKVTSDKICAWRLHTKEKFTAHFLPGGHFFVQESESILLKQINQELNEILLSSY